MRSLLIVMMVLVAALTMKIAQLSNRLGYLEGQAAVYAAESVQPLESSCFAKGGCK